MGEPVLEKVAEDPKSIHQILIRFSNRTAEDNDPFIRYWIKVYGNRRSEDGSEFEGKDVRALFAKRMAHEVLQDYYLNCVVVYIDDRIIDGRNEETFLTLLD